jgi:hypothetical protein
MEKNNVEHIALSQGRPAVVLHVHLYLKWNCKKPQLFPSAASGRPFGRVMEKNNGEHIAFSQGRPAVALHGIRI